MTDYLIVWASCLCFSFNGLEILRANESIAITCLHIVANCFCCVSL